MKDLIQSIFHTSSERIKNPLIGSYIIAALVFNWQAILIILFSEWQIEARINIINDTYLTSKTLLWFPLLVALLYTVILPYISTGVGYLVKMAKKKQIEHYYYEEDEKLVQKLKIVGKEVQLEREKADSKELSELNETIKSLERSNAEKDTLIKELRITMEERINELENEKIQYIDNKPIKAVNKEFNSMYEEVGAVDLLIKIANKENQNDTYDLLSSEINEYPGLNFLLKNKIVRNISGHKAEMKLRLSKKGIIYTKQINDQLLKALDNT